MSGDIEKENIIVQRFMWKDGDHKCEAGKLLMTLMELTLNEKHTTSCTEENIVSYLEEKGIVNIVDNSVKLADGKMNDAETLGDTISDYIGDAIESLPVDKEIKFMPSIHMMAIPIPVFTNNNNENK